MLKKHGSYLSCISFLIRLSKSTEKLCLQNCWQSNYHFKKIKKKKSRWGTQFFLLSSSCINFEQTAFHTPFFICSRMMHIIHGLQQKSELVSTRMEAASGIALFKCFTWIYLKFQLHSFGSCFGFALGTVEVTIFLITALFPSVKNQF